MTKLKDMWLDVFTAGEQTDSDGNKRQWTPQDLDTIVEKYNSQTEHEAPIVIGHPETDSPAYGWVEKLERRGDTLYAHLVDLTDEFVSWLEAKHYKKRSIAIYDTLLLKHIGFLGATPPAVKGLKNPEFSNTQPAMVFEFAETKQETKPQKVAKHLEVPADILSRNQLLKVINDSKPTNNIINKTMRSQMNPQTLDNLFAEIVQWITSNAGEELATQASAYFDELKTKYATEEATEQPAEKPIENAAQHSEPDPAIAELRRQYEESQNRIKQLEAENRIAAFKAYTDKLMTVEAKLMPAQHNLVVSALELAHRGGKSNLFAENGKTIEKSGVEIIKQLLESYPKFNELTKDMPDGKSNTQNYSGFEIDGYDVDADSLKIHNEALKFQEEQKAKNIEITYSDAIKSIYKRGK
jgi:hypothetical protein